MIARTRVVAVVVLLLAGLLAFFKIPVASSQGITLLAGFMPEGLPASDPTSEAWSQATAVEVPLSAQAVAKPVLTTSSIRSISARALHDGTQIAILVEWDDSTVNDQMIRVQDFRDSVALQFPLVEGQPFFCMGQPGGEVNIWHWKADWQADLTARQDMEILYPNMYVDMYPFADPTAGLLVGPEGYADPNFLPALASGNLFAAATHASPVEDSFAGGFGGLTAQSADGQNVGGVGGWSDGIWRVVFTRELVSSEEEDASFRPGEVHQMALAVWDGENDERNGQKSTSQWITLQLEQGAEAPAVERPPETLAPASPNEGLIFVVIPIVGTLLLIGFLVGGIYVVGSLMDRRK
jgi:hypothetical protein